MNQLFVANQIIPGISDGYERTIEVYQFNKAGQILGHSREVVIYDTEMKCDVAH